MFMYDWYQSLGSEAVIVHKLLIKFATLNDVFLYQCHKQNKKFLVNYNMIETIGISINVFKAANA